MSKYRAYISAEEGIFPGGIGGWYWILYVRRNGKKVFQAESDDSLPWQTEKKALDAARRVCADLGIEVEE